LLVYQMLEPMSVLTRIPLKTYVTRRTVTYWLWLD
jgi:hypothetical protein